MKLFFIANQALYFGGKFIKDLNTHIVDSLLVCSHPCCWGMQVEFLTSVNGVYVRVN